MFLPVRLYRTGPGLAVLNRYRVAHFATGHPAIFL